MSNSCFTWAAAMSTDAHKEITELIGRTPLVRLNRLSKPGGATIYGKVESFNPAGASRTGSAST